MSRYVAYYMYMYMYCMSRSCLRPARLPSILRRDVCSSPYIMYMFDVSDTMVSHSITEPKIKLSRSCFRYVICLPLVGFYTVWPKVDDGKGKVLAFCCYCMAWQALQVTVITTVDLHAIRDGFNSCTYCKASDGPPRSTPHACICTVG